MTHDEFNNSPVLQGKRVLVTGAAGSIGQKLVAQLQRMDVAELRLIDNNETELFFLTEALQSDPRVKTFLADIRDAGTMEQRLHNVDVVFHTAAFKHITLCERSPFEAVQSNILGVQNIIKAATLNGVKRVLFTSSDKAVNPTNVMGTTKLMGERLITAANAVSNEGHTIFGSTRFGNVAASRGSVIPIFLQQIEAGGPITLTDPTMTRFIMTLDDAVRLVIKSVMLMRGGEVFITKMSALRIQDLAHVMVELCAPYFGHRAEDISVIVTGARPGEKCYEELMTDEETRRSVELEELFVTLPAFQNLYNSIDYNYDGPAARPVSRAYHSGQEQVMSRTDIFDFLMLPGVLPLPLQAFLGARRSQTAVEPEPTTAAMTIGREEPQMREQVSAS